MSNKQKILITIAILISLGIGFGIGIKYGPRPDIAFSKVEEVIGQTFYASIEKIDEKNNVIRINAKGLEINDSNYRGDFTFAIEEETEITWRGEKIHASDLKEGKNISITFLEKVETEETPTPLKKLKIQVLNDEL